MVDLDTASQDHLARYNARFPYPLEFKTGPTNVFETDCMDFSLSHTMGRVLPRRHLFTDNPIFTGNRSYGLPKGTIA